MTLYTDNTGRLVEVSREENDRTFFATQGGGFEQSCPTLDFNQYFKPAPPPRFRQGFVGGDWLDESDRLPAWLNGLRWNGWAQPHFEKATADRILKETDDMHFDEARNAYVLPPDEEFGRDEEEVFSAVILDTPNGPVTTWPIGAGYWCWDELEQT